MSDRPDPETGLTLADALDVIADLQSDVAAVEARLSAAEAREAALRERVSALPCMFVWRGRREGKPVTPCDDTFEPLPEHAYCLTCRLRAALVPAPGSDPGATS